MEALALYHDGNLATLADFINENLGTKFDLTNAVSITIDLVEKDGTKGVYLFQVK